MRNPRLRPGSPASGRSPARLLARAALVLCLSPLVLIPLYWVGHPVSTLMLYERLFGPVRRDWVPLEEISPVLVASVLVSEDGRFCAHSGVDWAEMNKVLDDTDGRPRGASTIPMQTVKNLFLWTSRSYVRKGFEIPLAIYADLVWSKRRTMEIYLNVVEWGPGIFGAEAAARHYFDRSAMKLTAGQSALLAVTLPDPDGRDPARPSRRMRLLANTIAGRAAQAGDYLGCLYE